MAHTPPSDTPKPVFDHLSALTNCRITDGYLPDPLPRPRGTNPNLALWIGDDGIAARCHSAGCAYADIAMAIETRYGISINPRRYDTTTTMVATKTVNTRPTPGIRAPSPGPPPLRTSPLAPLSPHSQLIQTPRPAVACRPSTVAARATPARGSALDRRRTPAPGLPWRRRGDRHGGIAGRMGPPSGQACRTSAPCSSSTSTATECPPSTAASPSGPTPASRDAVIVLGCPHLENAAAPVDVAEGLADSLALAARSPAPAVATLGTSGMGLRHHRQMAGDVTGNPGVGGPR